MPRFAFIAVVLVCAGLASCGVRGALEPPPRAVVDGDARVAPLAGEDAERKPGRRFILDPLL